MRWVVVVALALGVLATSTRRSTAQTLNGHNVRLDSDGKLLSWALPQERAYDQIVRMTWKFMQDDVRIEANGLPTYLTYPMFHPSTLAGENWPHHPAGLFAIFADAAVRYHAYSGDRSVITLVARMLDHQLQHGTTPTSYRWAKVPYSASDAGSITYAGATWAACGGTCGIGDGPGVLEPDKVGDLGVGYLQFFLLTGDARYLAAGVDCANALVANLRPGDAVRSPWPYRVVAETGEVREEYTANLVGALRLFDELARLGVGDLRGYARARQAAWDWLLAYPMLTGHWSGAFEDIRTFNDPAADPTQYIPLKIMQYVLENSALDPDWQRHAVELLAWTEANFAVDFGEQRGLQYGAHAISEQKEYMAKMGNHTARYASVNALYAELTGDAVARDKAFRSFNWATYTCKPGGLCEVGVDDGPGSQIWFATGYADLPRNFHIGLGAQPEWAPPGEDHLLRSTTVVTSITYATRDLSYRTAGPSTDVLRLSFVPDEVLAGGVALPLRTDLAAEGYTITALGDDQLVRVRHVAPEVRLVGAAPMTEPDSCDCRTGTRTGSGPPWVFTIIGCIMLCAVRRRCLRRRC